MQEYTIQDLRAVPNVPSVPMLRQGSFGSKQENIRRLFDYRWRCLLKLLEADILLGDIQVVNETAKILRMSPELRIRVQVDYPIVLEEYFPERSFDVSPEPPSATEPQERPSRPPRQRHDLWHLQAVGLPMRGRRPPGIGRGQGITVAVIDSGAEGTHPELKGKILRALAVDAKGRVRRIPSPTDQLGHGTFVSSLVAGRTMGVAPDAELISIRVLDRNGSGTEATLLGALDWVARTSIEGMPRIRIAVLCLGFSKSGGDGTFQQSMISLMHRGILPIVAIGNDGPDVATSPGDCFGAVSVGAMTKDFKIAEFSGSGKREFSGVKYSVPSLVAPGESVLAATVSGSMLGAREAAGSDRYAQLTGGTPATAIVAGVAALLAEQQPDLDGWQLRDLLLSQCRRLPGEKSERQGAGLVQVKAGDAK